DMPLVVHSATPYPCHFVMVRSSPTTTHVPYTTLFRSFRVDQLGLCAARQRGLLTGFHEVRVASDEHAMAREIREVLREQIRDATVQHALARLSRKRGYEAEAAISRLQIAHDALRVYIFRATRRKQQAYRLFEAAS